MTVLTCASTGKSITLLGKEIFNSGEAKVWRTNENGYLAKIYHFPTSERVQKLAVMIDHPPTEPNSHLHHVSFAWPKSALKNAQGDCVGFLMPEIKDGKELIDVYNPRRRQTLKLEIDWRFLHTTALNIVSIIEALHVAGYVLGDIKPQNILVNNRALPSIIDTDSFQVINPKNGKVYRCLVGSPGYTPPELMGKDFDIIEQTEIHDRFRLGVIIYQLLFGGNSPFQGKWTGAGETPEPDEIIRRGLWLYSPNSLIEPVARTIPMIIVHPAIRECFLKCFNDGHKNPNLRPTARQWLEALRTGNNNLTICGRVDSHYYSRTFGNCYWCDRFAKLGIDIFPGNQNSYISKDADFYNNSGNTRYNLGDKQGAIDDYNQALNIDPNYASAYYGRGVVRYDLGNKQGAIDDYNQALNIDPNFASAYYGRGVVRYDLGDKQGAIDDYNQALNIDPNYAYAYNGRGFARYDLGDKQGAIDDYNQALNIDPNFAYAYNGRGNARYNLGDKQGAIDDYNQALIIDPNYAYAYNGRGNTRYDLGDKQGAIDDYNQALNIDPNFVYAYNGRGNTRYDLGDKQGAIDDYNQALIIDPNNAYAYNGRGNTRYDLGDKQGAIDDYNQALNIDPNFVYAYNGRGNTRYDLGDKQGAIDDYNQALIIDPNNAYAYNGRGKASCDLGDIKGAIDDYNQALNIDPNYINAYNNRQIALSDLQDKQGAINNSQKTLSVAPKYTLAYIKTIILHHKRIMTLVASLIFFAIANLFSSSNNINSLKNEPGKLTEYELREIANRKIEKYITGIGISFKIDEKTKIPTITDIFDNSPAASENLKVGDQIVKVDGRSTSSMTSQEVSNLIRGNADTPVFLVIRRSGYGSMSKMLIRQTFVNSQIDQDYTGRCYANLKLKYYSQALDDCSEAIQANANNNTAYFTRSRVHLKLGNRSKAMEDLREAARLGNEKAKEILRKNQ